MENPVLIFVLLLAVVTFAGLLIWVFYNLSRRGATDVEQIALRLETMERSLRDESRLASRELREEVSGTLSRNADSTRSLLDERLRSVQEETQNKLDEMRAVVNEQLHENLDKRFTESFRGVAERLEAVHRGLGEMQTLAAGVGDLKRVLSNVKTRGMWGEVQLANLLEQMLTPDQYAANVATKAGSNDRVEYAIKLPGREPNKPVWLPIDAKFPMDTFQRLIEASEAGSSDLVEVTGRQFESSVKHNARVISEKYLDPPNTTDFALMFLPTEGLYAEILRRPGLAEMLQHDFRVSVVGPTNLTALLNSLQLGFRTLAIEKRSSEVWQVLGEAKTEFSKYAQSLDKIKRKLQEATNAVDDAEVRTRAINRKLREVEEAPQQMTLLEIDPEG